MALLSRGRPFEGLRELEQRLEDLVEEAGGDGEPAISSAFRPSVDIYEQDDNIIVECELPGVDRDEIDISLENDRLTIQGERTRETEEKDEERDYYRSERRFESFQRSFSLPQNVARDQIKATFDDGVLKVVMPETSETTAQTIAIE